MAESSKYLRPDVISKIARLDLKAKFIVEGFIAGLHDSPYHGFSVEFSEHRKYAFGDDIKDIDWSVFAKTDKYYIRKYQAETNLNTWLIMDMSESMGYGDEITKLEYATYLAAALGYIMVGQQDPVGLMMFDEKLRSVIPPKSSRGHLITLLSELSRTRPGGRTDLPRSLHHIAEMLTRRSLVVLFTDLLDDLENIVKGLHHLRHYGHDIIVFQVLHADETTFPFSGPLLVSDAEEDQKIKVDGDGIRENYIGKLREYIEDCRSKCVGANIDFVQLDTATAFDTALTSFLMNRKKRF